MNPLQLFHQRPSLVVGLKVCQRCQLGLEGDQGQSQELSLCDFECPLYTSSSGISFLVICSFLMFPLAPVMYVWTGT